MIELLLCSLVTIFPDYLIRRYAQGKRIGREITLYSVWYELRWGITLCLLLTISLVTLILYFHPGTSNAVTLFRTIPILPEASGRVAEVYVPISGRVAAGEPIFRLDNALQEAAVRSAERRVGEIDAELSAAAADLAAAEGRVQQAEGQYQLASDELATRQELMRRNASTVSAREVERLQSTVDAQQGAVNAALASRAAVQAHIETVLPAQKASATADLAQAQVALDKTIVRAGVDGFVQQFTLRVGDVVNPLMRPAGVLIPAQAGRSVIIAGFNQVETQVLRRGMVAEAACISRPFEIIPLIVTEVQDVIAAGQLRPTAELVDPQNIDRPGTLTVFLQPLFADTLAGVPPGSSCFVNVYTNNHDELASETISTPRYVFLHVIDTVGLVHALLLRVRAILLPVNTLVFTGDH